LNTNTAELSNKKRSAANRRLETAQRFLRSNELGGCFYELRIVDLIMDGLETGADDSLN
jgi:hypothetical protein